MAIGVVVGELVAVDHAVQCRDGTCKTVRRSAEMTDEEGERQTSDRVDLKHAEEVIHDGEEVTDRRK